MSAIDTVARALLGAAARRWPVQTRDERLAEWTAEVHVLRGRPLAALRFALSLACSPAAEDPDSAVLGWRERLPGAGRVLQVALALLAVGGTSPVIVTQLFGLASQLAPPSVVGQLASMLALVLLLLVPAVFLGGQLAGAVALGPRGRALAGPAAMLLVWAGGFVPDFAADISSGGTRITPAPSLFTAVRWALLLSLPLLAYLSARVATSGRPRWAGLIAGAGALVILDGLTIADGGQEALRTGMSLATAPLWFPLSLIPAPGALPGISGEAASFVNLVGDRSLLVSVAFTLAFGLVATRSRGRVVAAAQAPAPSPAGWVSWPGLGGALAGLLIWAASLTLVAPAQRAALAPVRPETSGYLAGEVPTWFLEQQLGGALLATLGILIFLARRGPAVLPASLFGAALVTVGAVLARYDVSGVAAFAGALVGGLLAIWAVTMLGGVLGGGQPDPRSAHRVLVGAAVLAGLCAPAQYWQAGLAGNDQAIGALCAVTALTGVLLTVLAGAAALATRTEPPRIALVVLTIALPAGLMVAGGVLVVLRWEWAAGALVGGPLLAVLALAAARWTAAASWPRWLALGIGALVLGVPLAAVELYAGLPLGSLLLSAADYGWGADSTALLPGALLVGLPMAAMAAARPSPRRAPAARQMEAAAAGPEPLPELG